MITTLFLVASIITILTGLLHMASANTADQWFAGLATAAIGATLVMAFYPYS